eukprot:GHVT01076037.1.p2 GENE.GHVT01076037.1~~GHVT01076037.1.p2  ORF type:complete len:217 (-),score=32.27 GHVT01076037.1:27-677(-)
MFAHWWFSGVSLPFAFLDGNIEALACVAFSLPRPVFEAVISPQDHPDVFYLLMQMVGWDSVDDESHVSKYTMEGGDLPIPELWTNECSPPYSYWAFYMFANIRSLNHLLAARKLATIPFRSNANKPKPTHCATARLLTSSQGSKKRTGAQARIHARARGRGRWKGGTTGEQTPGNVPLTRDASQRSAGTALRLGGRWSRTGDRVSERSREEGGRKT